MKPLKVIIPIVLFVAAVAVALAIARDKLPQTKSISINIQNCQFNTADELKVKKDQNVSLKVTSDQAGEVHLHGYDLKQSTQTGEAVTFNFRAVSSGIFDIEHHSCKETHAMLVVLNDDGSEPKAEEHEETEHQETGQPKADEDDHTNGEPDNH